MAVYQRLGLIAGGGDLPVYVAQAAQSGDRLACVIALKGFADPTRYDCPVIRGIAQLGQVVKDLRQADCDAVCFAGIVTRPDFSALKPDLKGMAFLPQALTAAARGDDALLRAIVGFFEKEGFTVIGANDIADELLVEPGLIGSIEPSAVTRSDAAKALHIAGVTGAEDIGQGAVVCEGLVLAVEAQEGTDQMLARVAGLPAELRGDELSRKGVLAKRPKPGQERRIDLPVIGVSTVHGAARAGLAGIVIPAGGAMVLGREAVAQAADASGLAVWAVEMDGQADDANA
ncbi:LpxI family protein [Oceanicaulis sp. LC35]|uniref:LpxI family protein n=1 Tax=Oceanicaulis sp. LC35 TaxID=3349635 RepID=UPI003F8330BC